MVQKNKTIISASRRTDIPAFYYEWLQDCLKNKEVTVVNPMFEINTSVVDLTPENIHSIVLWSKDMSNVLRNPGYLQDYNLYFQYTITNYSKFLEPNVPEYKDTLKILEGLLKIYHPKQFNIRFDPIIISTKGENNPTYNKPGIARLNAFNRLLSDLKTLGMDDCRLTTSYISMYGHVSKKIERSNLDIIDLNDDLQKQFFMKMADIASKYNRYIYSCSNPILEGIEGFKKGHCIDGELLNELFSASQSKATRAKDSSQRKECGCVRSKDIGNYKTQKCLFGCKYCYSMSTDTVSNKEFENFKTNNKYIEIPSTSRPKKVNINDRSEQLNLLDLMNN